MADWLAIKAEYCSTNISYRKIAEKYGVSFNTLKDRAIREGWKEQRDTTHNKIATTTQQKIVVRVSNHEVDRLTRLLSIGDKLAAKLDEAAGQLDQKIVTHKRKTKTVDYGDKPECRKPLVETTVEEEILEVVDAPLDRQGLQQLTTALKNLHEVASAPKADEQGLAKIVEMMSRLDKEAASDAVSKPEADGVST